ncbi:MAG: bifunctional phosphopantothenoylcysteine decarboxylase/phosphopantothenate--cysteine ligase CoaBC [Eubacteriales bacterium]
MLKGKTILLGISGGIAAYKIANLCSSLVKQNADVHVIMTKNATEFITPLTFETLTGNKCIIDTFDRNFEFDVKHISIAKKANLILLAPATANLIAKLANGIADDMLTTTVLASKAKKLVAPSMNTNMYENPITVDNITKLKNYGFSIIEPDTGLLACKDIGKGKLPDVDVLFDYILQEIAKPKDMVGINVLITAGACAENIDPIRFISNHSTGKMGFAIARECALRGAHVTVVAARTQVPPPRFVDIVTACSASEMLEKLAERFADCDILFKTAAVTDYTPINYSNEKIKKSDAEFVIKLTKTTDILKHLAAIKTDKQVICGFSMETENMLENSRKKLENKNLDMIVANNLKTNGAGFACDTNVVTIITPDSVQDLPLMQKTEVAQNIIDTAISIYNSKNLQ